MSYVCVLCLKLTALLSLGPVAVAYGRGGGGFFAVQTLPLAAATAAVATVPTVAATVAAAKALARLLVGERYIPIT